jgi:hypothetical protein
LRVGEGRAVMVDEEVAEVAEVVRVQGQLVRRPLRSRLKMLCVRRPCSHSKPGEGAGEEGREAGAAVRWDAGGAWEAGGAGAVCRQGTRQLLRLQERRRALVISACARMPSFLKHQARLHRRLMAQQLGRARRRQGRRVRGTVLVRGRGIARSLRSGSLA